MALISNYAIIYYIITGTALSFYPIGIYYYKKGDNWKSTYSHMMLHLLCNVGNFILYSGAPLSVIGF